MNPLTLLRPRRQILGYAATLLPFLDSGDIDWPSFQAHLRRTADAGLVPAVNMDTGYGHLLDDATKRTVLQRTQQTLKGPFAAGAVVPDAPGAPFNCDAYRRQLDAITHHGGTPVLCQSHGLTALGDDEVIAVYTDLARHVDRWIAFELGEMFDPFGKIYSLDVYRELMNIRNCLGAKHSSLRRDLEWQRLALRNEVRPDFHVFTGNDLAIDMVMYGSDYLLGLATFAPEEFARRDRYWHEGDPRFYELNDTLQYLGHFAFRDPVPAYKHSAAQFLHLRGSITTSHTHPQSPTRPNSDLNVLRHINHQLGKGTQ